MKIAVRKHAGLLPLPTPLSAPPFELPSGSVLLFHDADWTGDKFKLSTEHWPANVRHDLAEHCQNRKAAWVAFNLPVGQVMTLTRHHRDVEGGQRICDLREVAQVADLVGTGRTEAVDLAQIDLGDAVSSFFWRDVDLTMGAIELYSDADFKGNRTILFLSEWPRGELHSLADWVIEDRLGSTRWSTMPDSQYCDLYQHGDGLGKQYPRMSGWHTGRRESADTSKYSLNDMVSAFRWDTLVTDRRAISSAFMDVLIDPHNITKFLMHRDEALAIA
jgi:hypothetical protein